MNSTPPNTSGNDFEKALSNLQKVVSQLESGELNLEQALKEYENGVKLTQVCQKILLEAEQKIEVLEKK